MKNFLHIGLHYTGWVVLGILVSFIVHAALEFPVLWLVMYDYSHYSGMWIWRNWELVYLLGTSSMLIGGMAGGLYFGYVDWKKPN